MSQSSCPTTQYSSTHFVESCGAILFDLSLPQSPKICLIKHLSSAHYFLPKGRRNIHESRTAAATREVTEETGYTCNLLPLTISTRACAPGEPSDVPDKARVREGVLEPFMCSVRELGGEKGVKIIWWYVAVWDGKERGEGEAVFKAEWFEMEEAVGKLWFETDREVVRRAVEIVNDTLKQVVGRNCE